LEIPTTVAAVKCQGIDSCPRPASENANVNLLKRDEGIEERVTSSGEMEMSNIPEGHHVKGIFGMLYVDKFNPRTQEDIGNIHIASETGSLAGIFETTERAMNSKIDVAAGNVYK
jgi:hypothetical protein